MPLPVILKAGGYFNEDNPLRGNSIGSSGPDDCRLLFIDAMG